MVPGELTPPYIQTILQQIVILSNLLTFAIKLHSYYISIYLKF